MLAILTQGITFFFAVCWHYLRRHAEWCRSPIVCRKLSPTALANIVYRMRPRKGVSVIIDLFWRLFKIEPTRKTYCCCAPYRSSGDPPSALNLSLLSFRFVSFRERSRGPGRSSSKWAGAVGAEKNRGKGAPRGVPLAVGSGWSARGALGGCCRGSGIAAALGGGWQGKRWTGRRSQYYLLLVLA